MGALEHQMMGCAILCDRVVNQRSVTVHGTYIHIQKNKIDLALSFNFERVIAMVPESLQNSDQAFGLL